MPKNIQQQINHLTWLIAMIEEKQRYIEQIIKPLYAHLGLVLSSEFCLVEVGWKNSKAILSTMKSHYRRLIKTGVINALAFKRILTPYAERMIYYDEQALFELSKLKRLMGEYAPRLLSDTIRIEKDLLKINIDLLTKINDIDPTLSSL